MPYGVLRRADVADVVALATEPGAGVTLYPALKVEPRAIADFDARHPEGADYVIVPAMRRDDASRAVLQWIKSRRPRMRSSSASAPRPRSSAMPGSSTASGRRPTGIS